MFEKASKMKLRFVTGAIGSISVEDLWDLPLKHATKYDLNTLAKKINKELQEAGDIDFVGGKASSAETLLKLKLDIIKRVIEVRLAEAEANAKRAETRERNQLIAGIIAKKKEAALEDLSIEDLQAMLG